MSVKVLDQRTGVTPRTESPGAPTACLSGVAAGNTAFTPGGLRPEHEALALTAHPQEIHKLLHLQKEMLSLLQITHHVQWDPGQQPITKHIHSCFCRISDHSCPTEQTKIILKPPVSSGQVLLPNKFVPNLKNAPLTCDAQSSGVLE